MISRGKLVLLLSAGGLLLTCLTILLLWSPYFPVFWWLAPKEEVMVLVPKGYEGQVLLGYEVPDGVQPEKDGDTWIYRLQSDGALLLRIAPPRYVVSYSFWYVDDAGHRTPIRESYCFDTSTEEDVVICVGGTYEIWDTKEMRPNLGFFVGRLEDYRRTRMNDDFWVLMYKYADKLAR